MEKTLLRADLNLLKVLYVLLQERNVAKAAERLFVTPSAISRSLTRLRKLFADPLLIRSSHGLVPTARAKQLALEVGEMLGRLDGLLEIPSFNPALARGVIRIAAPESFVLSTIPRLALSMKLQAPGLLLESLHLPDDYLQRLEGGHLDFVINHGQPYPEAFMTYPLISVTPLFWFRKDHPLRKHKEISLVDITSYPIISFHAQNVSRTGHRVLMQMIKDAGLPPPQIIIDTSHLFVALGVLQLSDSIMLGSEYLSEVPAVRDNFIAKPMENVPNFGRGTTTMSLIHHERTARSPLHLWVTEKFQQEYLQMQRPRSP